MASTVTWLLQPNDWPLPGQGQRRTLLDCLARHLVFSFSLGGGELAGVELNQFAFPLGLVLFVIVITIRVWARSGSSPLAKGPILVQSQSTPYTTIPVSKTSPELPKLALHIVKATGEDSLFRVGDAVKVMVRYPVGHYRVPHFIRGKRGLVEMVIDPAVNNEEEGFGQIPV